MITKEQKDMIRSRTEDYLRWTGRITGDKRKPITCPVHSDKHPSATLAPAGTYIQCWTCGRKIDVFELIGIDYNLPDFRSQYRMAEEIFGLRGVSDEERERIAKETEARKNAAEEERRRELEEQERKDAEFIKEAQARYKGSPAEAYVAARCISTETATAWGLGYGTWRDGKIEGVVIPRDDERGYTLRNINIPADGDAKKDKHRRSGELRLYRAARLYTLPVVYIVEGEFDGMAIDEITGGYAVAIGGAGTGYMERLIELRGTPRARVVIATDADTAGESKAAKIEQMIKDAGGITYRMDMKYKDANAWLINNKDEFTEALRKAWKEVTKKER